MKGSVQAPLPPKRAPNLSSGAAAQTGYEYQLNTSVLAALRLLLITKSATRITLEPANEEDLEADLAPSQLGRVVPSATLANGSRLIVQVKFRSGEPWSIQDFDNLLNHGEERTPAKHHLDDPDTRYLLVTNADAKGAARKLLVSDFEEQPDASDFPPSLRSTLPNSPEGRVAIWGGASERLIEFEIGEILADLLRVPYSRQTDCRKQLREEARRRMRGSVPGVWTRDDLLATIRAHGGYLASAAELVAFVKPSNFEQMAALLQNKNAIVITGPSGTGKTLAALALCDLMRQRNGQLEVVSINPNEDPAVTRRFMDTGPTLFYVEDPWGQYSLRRGAEAWTEQLPRLLKDARPGHQYVVTSRSDMLDHARADEALKRWSVELSADQYSGGELAQIYDKRMDLLATDLQPKALEFRKETLETLETPLELDLFFTNLADGPQLKEADHEFLRRLLGLAHRDAVEGVVVKYLDSIDKIGLSAVIWALLVARGQIERLTLTALQRQLRKTDAPLGDSLEKAFDRLVATRHLRQPSRTVSFAHPSVRAGFEAFLKENWPRNEATLQILVTALTGMTGGYRTWGVETAAHVLDSVNSLRATIEGAETKFVPSKADQATIDTWLEESLLAPDAEFQPLLKLAAAVGSDVSIPSELARWFLKGVRRGGDLFMEDWKPPEFSDAWYDRVSADPRSAPIADRFIREQLPRDHGRYGRDFVVKLDRVATGLTPAFLTVARQMVGTGFDSNVDAVAAGAIRDLDGYEIVLMEALDDLAAIQRSYEQKSKDEWRAIEDGEYDKAYEEHYSTSNDDEGYASGVFIGTYISVIREAGQWRELARHGRSSEFAAYWAHDAARSDPPPTVDELRAILETSRTGGDEAAAWEAALRCWDRSCDTILAERILAQPSDDRLRRALIGCACAAAPAVLVASFKALEVSPSAFVQLLVDVHAAQEKKAPERTRSVLKDLSSKAIEIFNAFGSETDAPSAIGKTPLAFLEEAAVRSSPGALAAIIPIMMASGLRPASAIRRWVIESQDHDGATAATKAAIATDDQALIRLALRHSRADARQTALEYLASLVPDPLPSELLSLADDRGSRVRPSLVAALSQRPHPDHLPVLMQLSHDRWSDADPHYEEPESYPIARDAVAAISRYGTLSNETGVALIKLGKETADRQLRRDAFACASELCGPEIRGELWALTTNRELGWPRVDAMDALSTASVIEADIVGKITAERLMRFPAPLAASAVALVSAHLPVGDAVRLLEQVGHSYSHRALLLVGAVGLEKRDRGAALGLLNLLDANHPARRLLESGGLLSPTALDDLGDVRIRRYVRQWLKDRIAKK